MPVTRVATLGAQFARVVVVVGEWVGEFVAVRGQGDSTCSPLLSSASLSAPVGRDDTIWRSSWSTTNVLRPLVPRDRANAPGRIVSRYPRAVRANWSWMNRGPSGFAS